MYFPPFPSPSSLHPPTSALLPLLLLLLIKKTPDACVPMLFFFFSQQVLKGTKSHNASPTLLPRLNKSKVVVGCQWPAIRRRFQLVAFAYKTRALKTIDLVLPCRRKKCINILPSQPVPNLSVLHQRIKKKKQKEKKSWSIECFVVTSR